MREMYEVSAPTTTSVFFFFFQISASIDNAKHIFVYLKKSCRNANGADMLKQLLIRWTHIH